MQKAIDNALTFPVGDELVVLLEGSDRIHILNPLATFIWKSLAQGYTPQTLSEEIARVFKIPTTQALSDIHNIIRMCTQQNDDVPPENTNPAGDTLAPNLPRISNKPWVPATERHYKFPRFRIKVRSHSPGIITHLDNLLPAALVTGHAPPDHSIDIMEHQGQHLLLKKGNIVYSAATEQEAAVLAFREIAETACHRENWLAILHAAGVAWQGQGLIMPARGGSGKTTLTAALITQGFQYINDDVIPIERGSTSLISIPTSLCIKQGSWEILKGWHPKLSSIQAYGRNHQEVKYLPVEPTNWASPEIPARHLLIPDYQPSASTTIETIPPTAGLRAIIEGDSLLHRPLTAKDIAYLTSWIDSLRCYHLIYSSLDEAVAIIKTLFENP